MDGNNSDALEVTNVTAPALPQEVTLFQVWFRMFFEGNIFQKRRQVAYGVAIGFVKQVLGTR